MFSTMSCHASAQVQKEVCGSVYRLSQTIEDQSPSAKGASNYTLNQSNNATCRVYLYPTPFVGGFPNYSPRKPDKGQSGYKPRASCKDCQQCSPDGVRSWGYAPAENHSTATTHVATRSCRVKKGKQGRQLRTYQLRGLLGGGFVRRWGTSLDQPGVRRCKGIDNG